MKFFRPGRASIAAGLTTALLLAAVSTAGANAARLLPTRAVTALGYQLAHARHGTVVRTHLRPDAPRSQPDATTYTLTVTGTNLAGAPATNGTAWLLSATNLAAFQPHAAAFHHGVARFHVPAGTYWVAGEFDGFSKTTGGLFWLDFLPQLRIQRNTTVHATARAATSQVTMVTPRPAVPVVVRFQVNFTDRLGSEYGIDWYNAPGKIWVSPVSRKPATGKLQSLAIEQLAAPLRSGGTPYSYYLDYKDPPGTIPPQRYVIKPSNLAVLTNRYYQDVKSTGAWLIWGGFPSQGLQAFWIEPLALPGTQIQYYSTAPNLYWSPGYNAFVPANGFPTGGQADDTFHDLRAGQHETVDWNQFPLHPQPAYVAPGRGSAVELPQIPAATRTGNKLALAVHPFSDNVPGHLDDGRAPGTKIAYTYQIDQNGTQIAHGNATDGIIPPATLSSTPSVIKFTYDATRTGKSYLLSTHSHTVWTWRSARQPDATLPASWYCAQVGNKLIRRCSVQPMMTLDYQVHNLALNGAAPAGPQVIGLTAGHLQLANAGSATTAAVWASFNGGKTWRKANITPFGKGQFKVTFTAPPNTTVTLRTKAADAAGGSITETITGAYKTS